MSRRGTNTQLPPQGPWAWRVCKGCRMAQAQNAFAKTIRPSGKVTRSTICNTCARKRTETIAANDPDRAKIREQEAAASERTDAAIETMEEYRRLLDELPPRRA